LNKKSAQQSIYSKIWLFPVLGLVLVIGFIFLGIKIEEQQTRTNPSSPPARITPTPDLTTNWKTYTAPNKFFSFAYPPEWKVNEQGGTSFYYRNQVQIDVLIHQKADKEYVENLWKSVSCGGEGSGCVPDENKETKTLIINNNLIYWKINGSNQIYAFIPSLKENKTVEIYTVYLEDKKIFEQILSTFKFINHEGAAEKVFCKEPRPRVCTMECLAGPPYICGSDGKSHCTACQACSDKGVEWYVLQDKPCGSE